MTQIATQASAAQAGQGAQQSAAFGKADAPSTDFLALLMGVLDGDGEGLGELGELIGTGEVPAEGIEADSLLTSLTSTDTSTFALQLATEGEPAPEGSTEPSTESDLPEAEGMGLATPVIQPQVAQPTETTGEVDAVVPELGTGEGADLAEEAALPRQATTASDALDDEMVVEDLPYDPAQPRTRSDSAEPRSTFAAQLFGQSNTGQFGGGQSGLGGQGQQQNQQQMTGADMPDLTANGIVDARANGDARQASFLDQLRAAQPQQGQPPMPPEEQVKLQVNRAVETGQTRISMQLRPAELGRIDIRLAMGPDGMMSASIEADSAETLEILRRDHAGLEKAIGNAGLNSDGAVLNFSLRNDGGQQGQQNNPFAAMADGQGEGQSEFGQAMGDGDLNEQREQALNNDPNQLNLDLAVTADGQLADNGRVDISV